jgi:anti-sigma factor RsiW
MAGKNLTPAELRKENARLEAEVESLKALLQADPAADRLYLAMFREIRSLRSVLADIASGAVFSDGKRGRTPKSRAKAALE